MIDEIFTQIGKSGLMVLLYDALLVVFCVLAGLVKGYIFARRNPKEDGDLDENELYVGGMFFAIAFCAVAMIIFGIAAFGHLRGDFGMYVALFFCNVFAMFGVFEFLSEHG